MSVIYFDLGKGGDYIYDGNMQFVGRHTGEVLALSDTQKELFKRETVSEIFPSHYLIQVNGFNDKANDKLDEWVYFLKNSDIKDGFTSRGLSKTREKLKEINLPPDQYRVYQRFLDNLHDEASIAWTIRVEEEMAIKKIREDAKAERLKEGQKTLILTMLSNRMTVEDLSRLTGVTIEKIQS